MLPCNILKSTETAKEATIERADKSRQDSLNNTLLELVRNRQCGFFRNLRVKLALHRGADPNSRDQYSLSCLHHAAMQNNAKQICQLVAAKANIDVSDRYGSKPLCYAIVDGKNEAANEIINQIKNQYATDTTEYLQRRNVANLTPLHLAASFNRPEILHRLLSLGVHPDGISSAGETTGSRTPLHCAAEISNFDLIEVLLDYGANKDAIDPKQGTIFDILRKKDIPFSRACLEKLNKKLNISEISK